MYAGKLWSTQAAFFAMSGIPDLAEIERSIFGFSQGLLKWSTHNDPLDTACAGKQLDEVSHQQPSEFDNRPSVQPGTNTLIDTFTLTAIVFEAERPPVATIVCGQEAGMQRALLCSYDPATRAFCKETVVRMEALCLERMSRMDRFRFALRRR